MNDKLYKAYYESHKSLRPSEQLVNRLVDETKIKESYVRWWLKAQRIYQIYLPPPKHINYPKATGLSDYLSLNELHGADLLYLTSDKGFKYVLVVVDYATRFKAAVPLKDKTSAATARGFRKIYETQDNSLTYPKSLAVDKGREFYSEVTKLMDENHVTIHRSHGLTSIVERFNQTLAKRLYDYQYNKELNTGRVNRQWVDILQKVINNINDEKTRLIGMSPNEAVEQKSIKQNPSTKYIEPKGPKISVGDHVRYLLKAGEHEGDKNKRRATDPYWSLDLYEVKEIRDLIKPGFYYLNGLEGHKLREELQLVEWLDFGDGPKHLDHIL